MVAVAQETSRPPIAKWWSKYSRFVSYFRFQAFFILISNIGLSRPNPKVEAKGGFLTEADTVVQPFHLPRFEHSEYHPAPNDIGTSGEQDELVDKVLNREGPNHSTRDPPSDTRLSEDQVGLKPDDDDLDLENADSNSYQTSVTVSDLESAVATFVPKSMTELAKEAESRREVELLHLNNPVVTSIPQEFHGKNDTQERVPTPRISNNRAVSNAKAPKARMGDQKPNTLDELGYEVNPGRDEASGGDIVIEGDTIVCSRKGTKQVQTSLKRKRKVSTPVTPAPSTRTLRPRAPKSAEKVKLEREAEEAYRIATAD